jgi:hypothetical protein
LLQELKPTRRPAASTKAIAAGCIQFIQSENALCFRKPNLPPQTSWRLEADREIHSGLAYGELFGATSYRATSIHIVRPSFDALVDCYKPINPSAASPVMVHEALAAISKPKTVNNWWRAATLASLHLPA